MARIWDDIPFGRRASEDAPPPVDLSTEPAPVSGVSTTAPAPDRGPWPVPAGSRPYSALELPTVIREQYQEEEEAPSSGYRSSPWNIYSGSRPYSALELPSVIREQYQQEEEEEGYIHDPWNTGYGRRPYGALELPSILDREMRFVRPVIEDEILLMADGDRSWLSAFDANPEWTTGHLVVEKMKERMRKELNALEEGEEFAASLLNPDDELTWRNKREELLRSIELLEGLDGIAKTELGKTVLDGRAPQLRRMYEELNEPRNKPLWESIVLENLTDEEAETYSTIRRIREVLHHERLYPALSTYIDNKYVPEELLAELSPKNANLMKTWRNVGGAFLIRNEQLRKEFDEAIQRAEAKLFSTAASRTTLYQAEMAIELARRLDTARVKAEQFINEAPNFPAGVERKLVREGADPLFVLAFGPNTGPMSSWKMQAQYGLDEDVARVIRMIRGIDPDVTASNEKWSYEKWLKKQYGDTYFLDLKNAITAGLKAIGLPEPLAEFGSTMAFVAPGIVAAAMSGGTLTPAVAGLYATSGILTAGLVENEYRLGHYGDSDYAAIVALTDWVVMNAQFLPPVMRFENAVARALASRIAGNIGHAGLRAGISFGAEMIANAGFEVLEDVVPLTLVMASAGINPLSDEGRKILQQTAAFSAAAGASMPIALSGAIRHAPIVAAYPVGYMVARYGFGADEEDAQVFGLGVFGAAVAANTTLGRLTILSGARAIDAVVTPVADAIGTGVRKLGKGFAEFASDAALAFPRDISFRVIEPELPPVTIGGGAIDYPVESEVSPVTPRGAVEDELNAANGRVAAADAIRTAIAREYGDADGATIVDVPDLYVAVRKLGVSESDPLFQRLMARVTAETESGELRLKKLREIVDEVTPRVEHMVFAGRLKDADEATVLTDVERDAVGKKIRGEFVVDRASVVTTEDGQVKYLEITRLGDERGFTVKVEPDGRVTEMGGEEFYREMRTLSQSGLIAEGENTLVVRVVDPVTKRAEVVGTARIEMGRGSDGRTAVIVSEVVPAASVEFDADAANRLFRDTAALLKPEVLEEISARLPSEGIVPVIADVYSRPPGDLVPAQLVEAFTDAVEASRFWAGQAEIPVDVKMKSVVLHAAQVAVRSGADEVIVMRGPALPGGREMRGSLKELRGIVEGVFGRGRVDVESVTLENGKRGFAIRLRNKETGEFVPAVQRWLDRMKAESEGKQLIDGYLVRDIVVPLALAVADYYVQQLRGKEKEQALLHAAVVAMASAFGLGAARFVGNLYRLSKINPSEFTVENLFWPANSEFGGDVSLRTQLTNLIQSIWRPEAKQTGFTESLGNALRVMVDVIAPSMARVARAKFEAYSKASGVEFDNDGAVRIKRDGKFEYVPMLARNSETGKVEVVGEKTVLAHIMADMQVYREYYGKESPFSMYLANVAEVVSKVSDLLIDLGLLEPERFRSDIKEGGVYFPRGRVYRIDPETGIRYVEAAHVGGRVSGSIGALEEAMPEQVTQIEGPLAGYHPRAKPGESEQYTYGPPGEALETFILEVYRKLGFNLFADVLLKIEDSTGKRIALSPSERVDEGLRSALLQLGKELESTRKKIITAEKQLAVNRKVETVTESVKRSAEKRLKRAQEIFDSENATYGEKVAALKEAISEARAVLREHLADLRSKTEVTAESLIDVANVRHGRAVDLAGLSEIGPETDIDRATALENIGKTLDDIEGRLKSIERRAGRLFVDTDMRNAQNFLLKAKAKFESVDDFNTLKAAMAVIAAGGKKSDSQAVVKIADELQALLKRSDVTADDIRVFIDGKLRRTSAARLARDIDRLATDVKTVIDEVWRIPAGRSVAGLSADAEVEMMVVDALREIARTGAGDIAADTRTLTRLVYELGKTEAATALKTAYAQLKELNTTIRALERHSAKAGAKVEAVEGRLAELLARRTQLEMELAKVRHAMSEQLARARNVAGDQRIDIPELVGYAFPPSIVAPLNRTIAELRVDQPDIIEALVIINNTFRTLQASADISFPFITGLLASYKHPRVMSQAILFAVRHLNDPTALGKFLNNFDEEASTGKGGLKSDEWAARGLFIAANTLGGEYQQVNLRDSVIGRAGGAVAELPVIRQSNQLYSIIGDIVRLRVAQDMYRALDLDNAPADVREGMIKEIIRSVHDMTGYADRVFGDFGAGTGRVMQFVQFAGRFFQSQLNTVADAAWGTGYHNAKARESLMSMIGMGLALTVFINDILGNETEFDPRSPNAYRIRIGDYDVSLFGPWDTFLKMFVEAVEAIPGVPGESSLAFRVRSRASPVVRTILDIATGENVVGTPVKSPEYIAETFLPFGVGSIVTEMAKSEDGFKPTLENLTNLLVLVVTSLTGIKASPMTPWEKYQRMAERDGVDLDDPLASRLYAQQHWDMAREVYSEEYVAIVEEHRQKLDRLEEMFKSGEISSAEEYVNSLRALNAEYGVKMEMLGRRDREPKNEKQVWVSSYFEMMDKARNDAGLIDRKRLNELEKEWIAVHGDEAHEYVQQYILAGKTGLAKEYAASMAALRSVDVPGVGKVNYFEEPYLRKGVLMSRLDEEVILKLRDIASVRKKAIGENADYSAVLKSVITDPVLLSRYFDEQTVAAITANAPYVYNDAVNAGKEKFVNPVKEYIKKRYPYYVGWFDPKVSYEDLQDLRRAQLTQAD